MQIKDFFYSIFVNPKKLKDANNTIKDLKSELNHERIWNDFTVRLNDDELKQLEKFIEFRKNNVNVKFTFTPCNIGDTIYLLSFGNNSYLELNKYIIMGLYSTTESNNMKLIQLTIDKFIYKNTLYISVKELDYIKTGFLIRADDPFIFTNVKDAINEFINRKQPANDTITEINSIQDINSTVKSPSTGSTYEIPCGLGTTIYWVINNISNRSLDDLVIVRNSNDDGIVKLTISNFAIIDCGLAMEFKEFREAGVYTLLILCDEIGKSVFFNLDDAHKMFSTM